MGRGGLSLVWAGGGGGTRPGAAGARGVLRATRAGGREPPRSDEAIAGNVRLGPSGAAAGKWEGREPAGPPAAVQPSPRAAALPATCAGLQGGRLLARPSAGGRAQAHRPERLVRIPLASRAPWLFIPRAIGVLFFAGPSTPPAPPRPHCADGHMSSCYERADTPGQLHVGVTRAEAPLPLYLESCSKSALDLLSCTCWNKRCVFGEVA